MSALRHHKQASGTVVCDPHQWAVATPVTRFGLTVRHWGGKQKDPSSLPSRLSFGLNNILFTHRNHKLNKQLQETQKQYAYLSVTYIQNDTQTPTMARWQIIVKTSEATKQTKDQNDSKKQTKQNKNNNKTGGGGGG